MKNLNLSLFIWNQTLRFYSDIPRWRGVALPGMALSVDKDGDEDDEGQGNDGHGDGKDQQQRVLVLSI